MPYIIQYFSEAQQHLRILTARQQALILESVQKQLSHQPTVQTRKRKLLRPNPVATWELRLGDIRVFYDVLEEPEPTVQIRAIGIKVRDRVYIAGQERKL